MEWVETQISDCIDCNPTVKLNKGNEYPLIDIDKITVGRKLVTNQETIVYDKQSGCKFQNGDTLMARITPCLENGKMAMASIPDKGIGSTELLVFRGIKDITDNDFVYYFLKQEYIRNLAANSMTGASGRQRADLKFIKKIKFKLPPLPIQRKIASILSTYDSLIENNTKRIKLLEQMAETLYKEWFVRFRFPGHENVGMENGLPKGWKVGRINEIAEINPLRILKKGETATYLDMGNMPTSGSFPIDWECKQYNGGTKFQNGDVLIARITPCLENGKIAYVYFLKDNEVAFGSTEYIVLAPKSNMISPFLYCMCRTNHFISYASNGMVGASGRQRVSGEVIGKYELIIPPVQILKNIKPLLDSFFYQIKLLSIQNQQLTRQRDLLLPRLMSGKLEVKA